MPTTPIATDPLVEKLIAAGAPIVVAISGGKDGLCAAIVVINYLRSRGATNEVVFSHAHLGAIEWQTSLEECEKAAAHFGVDLVVARRPAGGLIERWQQRWSNSVRRYENLEAVTVIPPWSSAKLRFCTSDTKRSPLQSVMRKRFGKRPYVNAMGIRRQESTQRAKQPVAKVETGGVVNWNPVIDYTVDEVFQTIANAGLKPHVAYTEHGATRVSCVACILASLQDLQRAAAVPYNRPAFRTLIEMELVSGFSFQPNRWLADVDPTILGEAEAHRLVAAKKLAADRKAIEARIPKHLKFSEGWPEVMPTAEEAELLAQVRREVSALHGFNSRFTDAESILAHYAALMSEKDRKQGIKDQAQLRKTERANRLAAKRIRDVLLPAADVGELLTIPEIVRTRQYQLDLAA